MAANSRSVSTGTIVLEQLPHRVQISVVVVPSCPTSFTPQQYARLLLRPQAYELPVLIVESDTLLGMRVASGLVNEPQQYGSP
jgi:hypothetical protein